MRRLGLILVLLVTIAAPVVTIGSAGNASPRPDPAVRLLAFRGHFGGFHLGGGYGRPRLGFGPFGRRSSSRGIFRRIARALAFAYLLHLLFSHGGLSILIWLIVIGLVIHMFRRRRRRPDRYAY
jgi:hypothetical protein